MFSLGDVLATTVRVWARRFPRWVVIALIFHVPVLAWYALHYVPTTRAVLDEHYYLPLWEAHPVLAGYTASGMWIVYGYVFAATTSNVIAHLRGERVSLGAALRASMRRAFAVFAVAFVIQVATVGLISLAIVLVYDPHEWMAYGTGTYVASLIVFCFLLASFVPVAPALIIEDLGVRAAIRRGFALGRGHRIKLFALCAIWQVLFSAVQYLLYELIVPSQFDDLALHEARRELLAWLTIGVELVLGTLWAVGEAVVYERLREAQEGPAASQLDRVFA